MSQRYSRRTIIEFLGGATLATGFAFASGRPGLKSAAATTFISGTPEPIEEKPLLRIEYSGGFVPVEYTLTSIPAFSLYADGRAITVGPMIEIFPQPALPNLRVMTLSEAGIERVLDAARTAGLFDGSANYDLPGIADAQSTVFHSTWTAFRMWCPLMRLDLTLRSGWKSLTPKPGQNFWICRRSSSISRRN